MSKLNVAARKRIPSSEFGLPKQRKYPEEDKPHAADAKAYASKELHAGKLSPSQAAQIRKKANKVLREA